MDKFVKIVKFKLTTAGSLALCNSVRWYSWLELVPIFKRERRKTGSGILNLSSSTKKKKISLWQIFISGRMWKTKYLNRWKKIIGLKILKKKEVASDWRELDERKIGGFWILYEDPYLEFFLVQPLSHVLVLPFQFQSFLVVNLR